MLKMKYFVLNPNSSDDQHAFISRQAIREYARWCEIKGEKEFANDLRQWINSIDTDLLPG